MITLNVRRNRLLSQTIAALVLAGGSGLALGQTMTLQNNQLQISAGSGTTFSNQTPTISSAGVVATVNNVPTTNGVGIPSFSFTILQTGVNDGTFDFRVGVVFTDANIPNRRMEAEIGQLRLTVAGGVITGTIPGSQTLRVLGRNGAGTVTADIEVNNPSINGPVTLTGGTVSFNATNLISSIRSSHTQFDTIILSEFNQPATYDYRIVVQQTASSNSQTLQFGTGPTFDDFPMVKAPGGGCTGDCVANTTAFDIALPSPATPNFFASDYTSAYTVTGRFNVVTVSSGGGAPAPSPSASPAVNVAQTTTNLNNIVSSIVIAPNSTPSPTVVTQVNDAVNTTSTLLSSLTTQLQGTGSTVSTTTALDALNTASNVLNLASTASSQGGAINTLNTLTTLSGTANVIGALPTGGLTQAEKDRVTSVASSLVASTARVISSGNLQSAPVRVTAVSSISALLSSTRSVTGQIPTAVQTQARQIATTVSTAALSSLSTNTVPAGTNLSSQTAVTSLAQGSAVVASTIVNSSPRVCGTKPAVPTSPPAGSRPSVWSNYFASVSTYQRALLSYALCISDVNTSVVSAVEAGGSALAATAGQPVIRSHESILLVEFAGEKYPAQSEGRRLVPSVLGDGVYTLPDGRLTYVSGGNSIEFSAASLSPENLIRVIGDANFVGTMREDGSLSIELNNNERFAGSFALSSIGSASPECATPTITAPTGNPASAAYVFEAVCATGVKQRITPYPDNTDFFTAIGNAGYDVRTDRNTGIISIKSLGNFRPSFFVTPLTTADTSYYNANKNADNIAFRAVDANRDGRMDYEVISANGLQLLYGMP